MLSARYVDPRGPRGGAWLRPRDRTIPWDPGRGRVDTHDEVDLVPLIGLPLALKIGAPVRLQPERRVGFRFQEDFRLAPDGWPVALGPVLFLEAWPTDGIRIGILVSAGF